MIEKSTTPSKQRFWLARCLALSAGSTSNYCYSTSFLWHENNEGLPFRVNKPSRVEMSCLWEPPLKPSTSRMVASETSWIIWSMILQNFPQKKRTHLTYQWLLSQNVSSGTGSYHQFATNCITLSLPIHAFVQVSNERRRRRSIWTSTVLVNADSEEVIQYRIERQISHHASSTGYCS